MMHGAGNACRMIGLHVMDHEIVGSASLGCGEYVGEPLVASVLLHRVHDGNLLVNNHVGVVTHAKGSRILRFENPAGGIVDANEFYIVGYVYAHLFLNSGYHRKFKKLSSQLQKKFPNFSPSPDLLPEVLTLEEFRSSLRACFIININDSGKVNSFNIHIFSFKSH